MSQQQLSFLDRFSFHLAYFLLGNVVVEQLKEATSTTTSQPVHLYWRSQCNSAQAKTTNSSESHARLVFADITWRFHGASIQVLFGFFLYSTDEALGIYYQCAPLTHTVLSGFAQSLGVDETSGPPVAIAELIAQALQATSSSKDGSCSGGGDCDVGTGGTVGASPVPTLLSHIPTVGHAEGEEKPAFLNWGLHSPQVQEVGIWKFSISQSTRQLDTLGLELLLRVPSQSKEERKSPNTTPVVGVGSLEATLERWWQHEQQLANIPEESLPLAVSSKSSATLPPPSKRRPNTSMTGPRSVPVGGSKKRKTKLKYLDSSNA